MNKPLLILIGGGGHCRSCIDVIELENKYHIQGIIDAKEKAGTMVAGYPVLGNDELITEFIKKEYYFLITIGQIKSPDIRVEIYTKLKKEGARIATIISPKAYLSPKATIAEGTILLHGVVVNAGSAIGSNCIINSLSLVEHDAQVGDHVHLSTGSIINGGCSVGNKSFIGSGAILANNISIGENVVIGAGSVVVKNILSEGVYAGNPAKAINHG